MAIALPLRASEHVHAYELAVRLPEIAAWRARVAEHMREWGAPTVVVDAVALGVSELLGNVHKHAGDPRCRLEVHLREAEFGPSIIRLSIQDRSPALPTVRQPDWVHDCGRGLWLLREVADDLGFEAAPGGKRVWMRCDFEPVIKDAP
ncbi:ATP-binding protein [Streptomyces sp. 6N223]|uniref:ATP-binding protein n=1 Tax=Streptomyces sp. 6N223 TaxID=3457412 RepID=UPI003FD087FC